MTSDKFNLAVSKGKEVLDFLSTDKDFLNYLDSINQNTTSFFNLSYYNLIHDKAYWEKIYSSLNERYLAYNGDLIPIFTTGISDDIICILNKDFIIIHNFANNGYELITLDETLNSTKEICILFKKRNGIV